MAVVEANISMSLDGFVTGPDLNQYPGLGQGGEILHAWLSEPDGQRLLAETFAASGAVITSRTVFDGTGGWGEEPPYRMPVFVLTHRPHEPMVKGETSFTFVTGCWALARHCSPTCTARSRWSRSGWWRPAWPAISPIAS